MAKKRRDTGIARLNNGYPILEETRDRLAKLVDKDGNPTHTIKEGFNPDRATTRDLEDARWSGFRVNNITLQVELWCLGKCKLKRSLAEIERKPGILADMHEEVFATAGTVITVPISEGLKHLGGGTRH